MKLQQAGLRATEQKRKYTDSLEGFNEIADLERLANKDYLKVADLAAIEADYYRAIDNYMRVAKSAVDNNLMRFSVKDYFLKAGICHLASGVSYPRGSLSRERRLIQGF